MEGTIATSDPGDLGDHSVYETYFKEFQFTFDSGLQTAGYDAETAGKTALTDTDSGGMYFMPFLVDLSGLNNTKSIHFDLYSMELARNSTTDLDVNKFAPFSHDAEGFGGRTPEFAPVPDSGSSLALMGIGLLGLAVGARRRA